MLTWLTIMASNMANMGAEYVLTESSGSNQAPLLPGWWTGACFVPRCMLLLLLLVHKPVLHPPRARVSAAAAAAGCYQVLLLLLGIYCCCWVLLLSKMYACALTPHPVHFSHSSHSTCSLGCMASVTASSTPTTLSTHLL